MCFITERMKNWLSQGCSAVIRVAQLAGTLSHVYAFLLLMSSKPRYQVKLLYIESGLLGFKEKDKST